jgi:hypothetical protein
MKDLIRRFANVRCASSCTACVLALMLLGLPSQTRATIFLTDRNSTVGLDLSTAAGLNFWGVDGVNQANQQGFWYRIGSSGPESPLSQITAAPTVTQANARQLSALYANPQYGVQVSYMLAGQSAGSGRSGLTENIRLYNYSSAPLDFHLFQYWDLSLGGPAFAGLQHVVIGTDGALFNNTSVTVAGIASFTSVSTPSANRGEATLLNETLARLNDLNPTDLNLGLTAGPGGGLGWALQWDFTIAANSSVVVSSINNLQVPEPTTFALLGLGVGALWIRRRR